MLKMLQILSCLGLAVMLVAAPTVDADAQGRQTGTVRGTVQDVQALPLPGVAVTVRSPALQGARTSRGSVATFGITRESPLGGPRYTANPNTLWIRRV